MELQEIFNKRRSFRSFTAEPVSVDSLTKIIGAAQSAPNSCNLQLTQFIVINDLLLLKKLSKEVSYKFKYSPCCIVVLQDSNLTVAHGSGTMTTGMMVENMILQATELGLGTCPMAGFTGDNKIKELLDIPKHLSVMLLLAIGTPDHTIELAPKSTLPLNNIYSFNSYSNIHPLNTMSDLRKISVKEVADYRERIAPIYLNRWRLATLKPEWFDEAINFIESSKISFTNTLDLISYDGEFAKRFRTKFTNKSLTVSDYITLSIDFLSKSFLCSSELINNNQLTADTKFDLITLVYKAEHTPKCDTLIESASKKLSKNGYFFIAVYNEIFWKKFLKVIQGYFKKIIKGVPINIYEQNTFYRIGPYRAPDSRLVCKWLRQSNCEITKITKTKTDSRGGFAMFYLAKKLPISRQ